MSAVLVTKELFDNMSFDTETDNLKTVTGDNKEGNQPSVLIVFANSDINAALYHLIKSLNSPFDPQSIATVVVQESIKEDFVEKLQQQFKTFSSKNIQTNKQFVKALETAKKLNAHFIILENRDKNSYQPTLVCDFTHEQLGPSTLPSGIVTLHTFRTAKEAISLVNKESLKFTNISIWHQNHSYAYELVATLKSNNFFINCHQTPLNVLEESIKQEKNYVVLDKLYHYETLQHDGVQKSIVFPIGSIYAN